MSKRNADGAVLEEPEDEIHLEKLEIEEDSEEEEGEANFADESDSEAENEEEEEGFDESGDHSRPESDDAEGDEFEGSEDESEGSDLDEEEEEDEEHEGAKSAAGASASGAKAESDDEEKPEEESGSDTSEDEGVTNTVGNIPLEWYKDYPHIGYDREGQKIMKRERKDGLDQLIARTDDPNYVRTVIDEYNDREKVLTDQELEVLFRIQKGVYADPMLDPEEMYQGPSMTEDSIFPMLGKNQEPHKKSFIPSKWEAGQVTRIVKLMRQGKYHEHKPKKPVDNYMLWDDNALISKPRNAPPPKAKLPGHAESYNPPQEYLFTKEELEKWRDSDPKDRKPNFLPKKFSSMREVPAFKWFVKERFERCLDLYLCPRVEKTKREIDPESLLPELPKPSDLRPFPSVESNVFRGHTACIRSLSVDPTGQWLVSGSDDETVRMWEVATGRCLKVWNLGAIVYSVEWNPNPAYCAFAAAAGENLFIIESPLIHESVKESTARVLSPESGSSAETDSKVNALCSWETPTVEEQELGIRCKLVHKSEVKQVTWHHKGDYMATVCPDGQVRFLLVHQLSRKQTQNPFKNVKGAIQKVLFHPNRPFLFVATQRWVKIYNLAKQSLVKKLEPGVKWISSIDVHPQGDNVIIGSYDKKVCWFDLDLSSRPYKTLRYHTYAVRQVAYHKRYPLFASCSDDASVHVFHGMVYDDLLKNPLIVPVKILKGHELDEDHLGVLSCVFHPIQPWLFTSGADMTIRLFT